MPLLHTLAVTTDSVASHAFRALCLESAACWITSRPERNREMSAIKGRRRQEIQRSDIRV